MYHSEEQSVIDLCSSMLNLDTAYLLIDAPSRQQANEDFFMHGSKTHYCKR